MSLPDLLSVEAVMARYGAKDRRTARNVMHDAGAFTVAGKLVVREDDLGRWEQRQVVARRFANPSPVARREPSRRPPAASPASGPDWWRADAA